MAVRTVKRLIEQLQHPDALQREDAAIKLCEFKEPRAVQALIAILGDTDWRVRFEAERSLLKIGAPAIGSLIPLLGDVDSNIADSAAKILGQLGATAVDALLDSLASSDSRRRRSAAVGLGLVFRSSNDPPLDLDRLRRGMAALLAVVTDTHAEVRVAIAEALGKALVVARAPSADWRSTWQPPSGYPRTAHPRDSAEIKIIDDLAESSIHCLVQVLKDSDPRVRRSAAAALGWIRSPATRDALLEMLKRPIESERIAAAVALIRAHNEQDATGIVAALADEDVRIRYATIVAIMSETTDSTSLVRGARLLGMKGHGMLGNFLAAGFFLMKDYSGVSIPQAVSQILMALTRLVKEETNTHILRAALQALSKIGTTIRDKREHGDLDILYCMSGSSGLKSRLHLETEEEIVAREAISSEVQRSEAARFTDLCVYEGHLFPGDNSSTARRLPDEEALCAGREYTLEVAIRRERFGIAAATPAPRAVLNPRRTTETLKIFVVVKLLGPVTISEQVAALDWPYDADSSPVFFRLTVPETVSKPEEVRVEVRLYHQNLDLLDVVNLSFFVAAEGETDVLPSCVEWPRSSKAEPCLDPDAVIRNLSIRIGPATEGYRLEFIFLRGDRTISFPFERYVTSGDLESLLTKVRDFWTELAITNYESRLSVTTTTWNRYLARLHDLGSEAWEMLFGSRAGSQKGATETIGDLLAEMELAAGTHLQITYDRRITDFVFPWNILYPPADRGAAVDPLLFWGARYQIEQVWEGGSHDGLEAEPVGVAIVIDPGFGEVQPEIDMFEAFKASAGDRLEIDAPVANRQGLFLTLAGPPSRHFYYFFCHGYAPVGSPVMRRDGVKLLRETIEALSPSKRRPWDALLALTAKMADEAWMFIGDAQITESELRRTRDFFAQRRPIMFLNMCHSAALVPSMTRGLLRLFLDRDAAAVIGTESPMTSVFAHAFARELFKHLFGGSDIGTALWRARRHFLADNLRNPLGFAYTLYGRATAKLGVRPLIASELT